MKFLHAGQGSTANRGYAANQMGDNLPVVDLGTGRKAMSLPDFLNTPCATLDNGTAKCWGRNTLAQVGDGSVNNRGDGASEMGDNLPALNIGTGVGISSIFAGDANTFALTTSGLLKGWGNAGWGALGDASGSGIIGDAAAELGDNTLTIDIGTNRFVTQTSAMGTYFACALTDLALVKCWGRNSVGNLGLGNASSRGDNANEMGDYLPFVLLW